MMDDEYEIFPHKVLEDLKYDIGALKNKLSAPDTVAQELVAEMEDLKVTLKELNNIFKEALQDVKEEDTGKLLNSLYNKIETVTTQNETIARGMVAISDKLEEFMKGHERPSVRSNESSFKLSPPLQTAAQPLPLRSNANVTPPPPTKQKRKSIFG